MRSPARLAAALLCVVPLAGLASGCRGDREAAETRASVAGPPFVRTGATRDLLCDLERATRGTGAGGNACTCDDVPRTGRCGHVAIGHDRRRALLLDAPSALAAPLDGGDARVLRFALGASATGGEPVGVRVTASGADGAVVGTWDGKVQPLRGWRDASLELSGPVAKLAVDVTATGSGAGEVALASPRLVVPTTASAASPTNVVVYLMDTLRADHTSAYGYARDTTPSMRRLAENGIRFDVAYSTAARTRPSTASLLTGLMPAYHGAHSGYALSPQVTTLAERFRASGWSTWAFVTNGHVFGNGLNFEQGFDRFQAVPGARHLHHARTEEVNEVLFPHLDAFADEPFLLYVHALDPHAPYDPPEGYAGRFTDPKYAGPVRPEKTVTADLAKLKITDADRAHVVGLYDEDILYQDAMFGLLLERLEKLGVRDRTIVVVVSDHGEEFLEHGAWAHGGRLYEEQTRVPLLVHVPGVAAFAGRTVPSPVQIVDVMPSLLGWFGLDGAVGCQGRDLTPLLAATPPPDAATRPIYCEETTYTAGAEIKSLRVGGWKIVKQAVGDDPKATSLLFDLATDPGELQPVGRKERRRLFETYQQLIALEASWARTFRANQGAAEQLDERTRQQLEALGYVME